MTTFDGSTSQTWPAQQPEHDHVQLPAAQEAGLDTLTLLKQTVADRVIPDEVTIAAPGGRIRLVCHNDIPDALLRKWQRASLSPDKRKSGNAGPLDSSQLTIAIAALVYTTKRIEVLDVRDNETWRVVESNGEPLDFNDTALLRAFGAMDSASALIEIFGRESDVVYASQEIMRASGWTGENGDDDGDPR